MVQFRLKWLKKTQLIPTSIISPGPNEKFVKHKQLSSAYPGFKCSWGVSWVSFVGTQRCCQDSCAAENGSLVWPRLRPLSTVSWVLSALDAVEAERHLSKYVSSAGTQPALFRVRTGTAEQQRLLLKATASTPGAIWRKQVIHTLLHTGAA